MYAFDGLVDFPRIMVVLNKYIQFLSVTKASTIMQVRMDVLLLCPISSQIRLDKQTVMFVYSCPIYTQDEYLLHPP